eukprot:3635863-Ditylum_brightwellii.AAC.1
MKEVYSGINLEAHNQRVPYLEINVHTIAIAMTNAPPDLDHSWDFDNRGEYNGKVERGKRFLLKGFENRTIAFKKEVTGTKKSALLSGPSIKSMSLHSLASTSNPSIHHIESVSSGRYSKRHFNDKEEIIPGQGWVIINGEKE